MPIASFASYLDKVALPLQTIRDAKGNTTDQAGRMVSGWFGVLGGAVPTTPVAPDRSTTGAMGQQDAVGVQRLAQAQVARGDGTLIVCDRLSHQSGLSGIVTTAQTTNLPTAPLTRYTNGVGVLAALEIYVALGAVQVGPTMEYTNQAGVGGRVSPAGFIGGSEHQSVRRFIAMPLQAGDTGVRSVESVTLSASTGSAGNFGVVLYRPLFPLLGASVVTGVGRTDAFLNLGGLCPVIEASACLFYVAMGGLALMLNELRFIGE